MKCEFVEKNLVEYIEGNLHVREEHQVTEHLKQCRHCEQLVQKSSRFWDSLDSVHSEPVPVGFYRGIQRKLLNMNLSRSSPGLFIQNFYKTLVPVMAATALLIGLFLGNYFGKSLYKNVYSSKSYLQTEEVTSELLNFELFNGASDVALINTYYENVVSLK